MNVQTISTQVAAGVTALALLFVGTTMSAQADHLDWDTSGDYNIAMDFEGTPYTHDLTLVQDAAGNLTGEGGYPADGPHTYHWVITEGSVSNNDITFTADYTMSADAVTPQTTLVVIGTIAEDGSFSGTWSDNYQGGMRGGSFETTSGMAEMILYPALAAEDFGVMDQSGVKGYTAGFGLSDAMLADIDTVVVQLYSGATLLQTNTGTDAIADLSGSQFSSPFDVSGTFDYMTDGYWTNVRGAEYGQTLVPTKVVATVTLDDGTVLTAENTMLTGDPSTVMPDPEEPPVVTTPTTKDQCKNGGYKDYTNPTFKNQGQCVAYVNHNN